MKWILPIICLAIGTSGCSGTKKQGPTKEMNVQEERAAKNEEFRDPESSPLPGLEAIAGFKGLEYFPIDSQYVVTASVAYTPDVKPFKMASTKNHENAYKQYAILHFALKDTMLTLNLYRNLELAKEAEYHDYFFIPFKDLTNGTATYGGGRYLDIRFTGNPDTLFLDFNRAYNPYCAYNYKYSCPVPPEPNHLPVAIGAGEKMYPYHP